MQMPAAIRGLVSRFKGGPRKEGEPSGTYFPQQTETPSAVSSPSATLPKSKYEFPAKEHPLNGQLHKDIAELFSQATFRQIGVHSPAMSLTFPLSTEEFRDAPTVSRLLHLKDTKDGSNIVDMTVAYGWVNIYDEPVMTRGILIPRLAYLNARISGVELNLNAGREFVAKNGEFDDDTPDNLVGADVNFTRERPGNPKENLFAFRNVNSLKVLSEVQTIMGRLRTVFELQEQRRAESLLTPRQKAAIEALAQRSLLIRKNPSDGKSKAEYLISCDQNEQGKLTGLELIFSPGSDRKSNGFRQPIILDKEPVSWLNGLKDVAGNVSVKVTTQKTENLTYSATGVTTINRADRHLAETIPTSFQEVLGIHGITESVGVFVTEHFVHFLQHQAKMPHLQDECRGPIILASSLPITTRF